MRVDVGVGWSTIAFDDALLITPAGGDDFAIVIVRGRVELDDADAVARLGTIGKLALSDAPREGRATSVRVGSGTLAPLDRPVVVRLARIRDHDGRFTFVAAAIATPLAERGEDAFDRVVRSLALVEPTPPVRDPALPPWILRRPPPPEDPAEPTEEIE